MLATEKSIARWREATAVLRPDAVGDAAIAYFDALGETPVPSDAELAAANHAAARVLAKRVVSPSWMSAITGADAIGLGQQRSLELSFTAVRPELKIPEPLISMETPPVRLAMAAFVGAICGLLILTPICRLLLGMRDVGLVVGAPLGALLTVLAAGFCARNAKIRALLVGAVAGAAVVDVGWQAVKAWTLGGIWGRLHHHGSLFRRILLYIATIFVLLCIRSKPSWDRHQHEATMRIAMDQWLDAALLTVGLLAQPQGQPAPDSINTQTQLAEVASRVLELRRISPEHLPTAAEELVQSLKNMGFFAADQLQESFEWTPEHREQYDVFGHVEIGDRVLVEREPVMRDGEVLQKGLLRKLREEA